MCVHNSLATKAKSLAGSAANTNVRLAAEAKLALIILARLNKLLRRRHTELSDL